MRKDTRFNRPDRSEIEAKLPPGTLAHAEALGIWNMMLQADDPSEVARWYRTYRDSEHCSVPRPKLRAMRDTMITAMRDANKEDNHPRLEKKKGIHYSAMPDGWMPRRTGA